MTQKDVKKLSEQGDAAEFGRLIEAVGSSVVRAMLGLVYRQDVTGSPQAPAELTPSTFEDEESGAVITTNPAGIAFRLGEGHAVVSLETQVVLGLLRQEDAPAGPTS